MDANRAKELLQADRQRTKRLLDELVDRGQEDRAASSEPGDMFDSAEPLVAEGLDDSVLEELKGHLEAITRAERRLEAGNYGYSVRSGVAIPDERLEADPTAELTVEEARQPG